MFEVKSAETYETAGIKAEPMRPHILAAATVVYGDDYYHGRRETISLSGMVEIRKWPMEGFRHRVGADRRAEFDLELISAPEVGIKGFSYVLGERVQILSNPYLPNTGTVRQIVPGRNFPADFFIRRHGVLETKSMRLAHHNVINIHGVVDRIPPYTEPLGSPYQGVPNDDWSPAVPSLNLVRGINLPEAWYMADEDNNPAGGKPMVFFASEVAPCASYLANPSEIVQVSASATAVLATKSGTETVEFSGSVQDAAGVELLLFEPDKHHRPSGILAQMSRIAIVGESRFLGRRIMIRASFFHVSGGYLGKESDTNLQQMPFPADLAVDAWLEVCTPQGELYAMTPVHLDGRVDALLPTGSVVASNDMTALRDQHGTVVGSLSNLRLTFGNGVVGNEAPVNLQVPEVSL